MHGYLLFVPIQPKKPTRVLLMSPGTITPLSTQYAKMIWLASTEREKKKVWELCEPPPKTTFLLLGRFEKRAKKRPKEVTRRRRRAATRRPQGTRERKKEMQRIMRRCGMIRKGHEAFQNLGKQIGLSFFLIWVFSKSTTPFQSHRDIRPIDLSASLPYHVPVTPEVD